MALVHMGIKTICCIAYPFVSKRILRSVISFYKWLPFFPSRIEFKVWSHDWANFLVSLAHVLHFLQFTIVLWAIQLITSHNNPLSKVGLASNWTLTHMYNFFLPITIMTKTRNKVDEAAKVARQTKSQDGPYKLQTKLLSTRKVLFVMSPHGNTVPQTTQEL